jgi:hypothetical protein
MSHVVSICTQVRDPVAVAAACQRLGLSAPVQGTAKLFSRPATGLLLQLPGWRYPVVVDTASGTIQYDNYNEHWGKQAELNRLLQAYACEVAKLEARKKGYAVSEQLLQDGSIRVQIVTAP